MSAPGLRVERQFGGQGWIVTHERSGKSLGLWLRLQRQAEALVSELSATGEDFTLTRDQLKASPKFRKVGAVLEAWAQRARYCCDGGEHYDPLTYAMDGHCSGPMSNGKPRRS